MRMLSFFNFLFHLGNFLEDTSERFFSRYKGVQMTSETELTD